MNVELLTPAFREAYEKRKESLKDPFLKQKEACERKRTFRLKVHAEVHILQELNRTRGREAAEKLSSYQCPVCGFWHMTSK